MEEAVRVVSEIFRFFPTGSAHFHLAGHHDSGQGKCGDHERRLHFCSFCRVEEALEES